MNESRELRHPAYRAYYKQVVLRGIFKPHVALNEYALAFKQLYFVTGKVISFCFGSFPEHRFPRS